ncbi:MAG: hypothetical protein GWN71_40555, partial [Gammaproteobacteria bacterium]|nr:hypothetical protein [Gemmatimonadota bacterium]NIU79608.1 hypothetical protein [Gammaproteobacteria bacterium]NIX25122.1 hypothetical protein [Actinomycetota bacterium]
FAALSVVAGPAHAQLISLKTVPLATGDQFQLFPSERVGVGGGIALTDLLRDPFARPATGARLDGVRFFGSPVLYDYAHESGGGLTLPVGALLSGDRWFGGVAGAIQELRPTQVAGTWFNTSPLDDVVPDGPYLPPSIRDDSRVNSYAFGLLGLRLGEGDAVAVSGFGAWLEAVQGIEEMYDGNVGIVQDGWIADVRLGWLHRFERGGSLDVVLLHDYVDM